MNKIVIRAFIALGALIIIIITGILIIFVYALIRRKENPVKQSEKI